MILLLPVQLAGSATAAADCAPGFSEAAPGIEINVDITEGSVEAPVTESEPGMATFHGTVTVQMPTLRGATVTLTSGTDIGWVSSISPATFVLDNGQIGSFTVTVVVPQGTVTSQNGNLMVNGRAVASGVQATDEDTALVTVRSYHRLVLDAGRRTVEIAPGGTARFPLRITNAGNSIDSFSLKFTNQDELRRQGWSLTHTNASLERVVPGEYRLVTISLTAPAALSPYVNKETTLSVRAESLGAREHNLTATLDYPLVAKETGVSVPGVGAVALVAVVIAVAIVVFGRRRRRMQLEAAQEAQHPAPDEPA